MSQEDSKGSTWLGALLWGAAGMAATISVINLEPNLLEEGLLVAVAQRIQAGERLYRDVFAFYGAVPFEVLGLLFRFFGQEIVVARGVIVVLCGVASAGVYDLARRSGAGIAAHAAAACVACVAIVMFPFFSIYFYTTISYYLALIAACAAVRSFESDRWAVATGVLIACTALSKQTVGACLAITLLPALAITCPPGRRLRTPLAAAAGGLIMAVLTLTLYGLRGVLSDMVYSLVVFPITLGGSFTAPYMNFWPLGSFAPAINGIRPLYLPFSYVMREGVFAVVSSSMILFTQLLYALPFAALAATALRRLRGKLPAPVWIHTATLIALSANVFPRTDWGHLVFVLAPALVQLLLLAPVFGGGGSTLGRRVVTGTVLTAVAGLCIVEGTYLHGRATPSRLGPRIPLRPVSEPVAGDGLANVVQYLRRHVEPGEYIFVARAEPLIYFATDTRNPVPYSGVLPGIYEEQSRVILAGLEKVRFVVMSEIDQPLFLYYRDELPAVQDYLERYFELPKEFLGKRNASWIVVLKRREDRGETAIDLFWQREGVRAWTRDREGAVTPTEAAPALSNRHNRRPLGYQLGPRGGGIDWDVELPESAVFEASVGFKNHLGTGARYHHQRRSRLAVSVRSEAGFERLKSFPVFFRNWLDYGWMQIEVDLSAYSGKQVTLRVELVPSGPVEADALGWLGSPRIISRAAVEP